MKLRRSICYTQGYDLEGTKTLIEGVSDCILIDLEDSVPPPQKPLAREVSAKMLQDLDFQGKERVVRINSVDSEYYSLDMNEVIAVGLPDSIRIPKCEQVDDILMVDKTLTKIEKAAGLDKNTIDIWAMIESPIGIRNAYDIACCCERLTALTIGMEDLNRDMNIDRRYINSETDLLYARQKLVLDAKAAGVQVLDTVLLVDNEEINNAYTLASRQTGFDGRAVFNEREAVFANKVYFPSAETFDWAKRVIEQFDEDAKKGVPCIVDGKSICYAVYRKAQSLIDLQNSASK